MERYGRGGCNFHGLLGNGTTTHRSSPVKVSGLGDVIAIAAGDGHSMALKSDWTVWVWGDNEFGELEDGTTTDSSYPVQTPIKLIIQK